MFSFGLIKLVGGSTQLSEMNSTAVHGLPHAAFSPARRFTWRLLLYSIFIIAFFLSSLWAMDIHSLLEFSWLLLLFSRLRPLFDWVSTEARRGGWLA